MSHIHTEPGQHDLTASAVVIKVGGKQPQVLLHLHKTLGVYLQFGGHVELHETPWQAVIHELREESGYDIGQLKLLQPVVRPPKLDVHENQPVPVAISNHVFPLDVPHFHTDIMFALVTTEEPRHQVAKDESSTFKLFSAADLRAAGPEIMYKNIQQGALYILDTLLHEWELVSTDSFVSRPTEK